MAICEKSGLEFEAKSKRQKNHPAIMNLVNEANKDGWYRECLQALEEYKGKFSSVDEYAALLETVRESHENKVSAIWRQKYAEKLAEKEARRERAYHEARLFNHGYHFEKVTVYEDDEYSHDSTVLIAPDGASVSVQQALAEIENPALVQERLAKQDQPEEEPMQDQPKRVISEKEQMRAEAAEKVLEEQKKRGGPRRPSDPLEFDTDLFEYIYAGWTREELDQ